MVRSGFFGEELYFKYMTSPKVPLIAAIKVFFSGRKVFMRKIRLEMDSIKLQILAMKGSRVAMYINKGRKKIIKLAGTVVDVYPSVFTVRIEGSKSLDIQSYSFSDVLTGDVRLEGELQKVEIS